MNDLHIQYRRETGHRVKNDSILLIDTNYIPEHFLIEVIQIRDFIPDMHVPQINMIDPDYVKWLENKLNVLQPNMP